MERMKKFLDATTQRIITLKSGVEYYEGKAFSGYIYTKYPTGSVKDINEYKDGYRDGLYIICYPNGRVNMIQQIFRNDIHGYTIMLKEDNIIERVRYYVMGDEAVDLTSKEKKKEIINEMLKKALKCKAKIIIEKALDYKDKIK